MNEALEKIDNTLELDNIVKYIDDYKKFGNETMKEREEKYFPEFEGAEKAMKKIAYNRVMRETEKGTGEVTKEAENEHNTLLKQIGNSKNKLLNEIP